MGGWRVEGREGWMDGWMGVWTVEGRGMDGWVDG